MKEECQCGVKEFTRGFAVGYALEMRRKAREREMGERGKKLPLFSMHVMATEIYGFLEKKYADTGIGIRDLRRALRRVIDRLDLYEILQEMTEANEILIHPFKKGYKKRIFPKDR